MGKEVDLALEPEDLLPELGQALLKEAVSPAETFGGEIVGEVEAVELVGLGREPVALAFKRHQELALLREDEVAGKPLRDRGRSFEKAGVPEHVLKPRPQASAQIFRKISTSR